MLFIKGNFPFSFFLFLSSRYCKIESISSFTDSPRTPPERLLSTTSGCLKRLESIASWRRVCLNFYFVALKMSMFLSYFCVSSLFPWGFYSKIGYLPLPSPTFNVTPLKYSCFNILYGLLSTLKLLGVSEKNTSALIRLDQWLPLKHWEWYLLN